MSGCLMFYVQVFNGTNSVNNSVDQIILNSKLLFVIREVLNDMQKNI